MHPELQNRDNWPFSRRTVTNYAISGGSTGKEVLSKKYKGAIAATNFVVAGYGAAIQAIGEGANSYQQIIQSILIGKASADIAVNIDVELSAENSRLLLQVCSALAETFELAHLSPGPVPINSFCLQPENKNLKGLCK